MYKFVLAILLIFASNNAASLTMQDYFAYKGDKITHELNKIYLKGVYEGFAWANAELETTRKSNPIFCTPEKIDIKYR